MWRCELDDDATEADVTSMAQQWLAAAKKMEGGAQFTASVFFPVAVNATGEVDFIFVVSAPSFQEWGTFWDSYAGSPAEKLDAGHEEKITCPNSVLWESLAVTAK